VNCAAIPEQLIESALFLAWNEVPSRAPLSLGQAATRMHWRVAMKQTGGNIKRAAGLMSMTRSKLDYRYRRLGRGLDQGLATELSLGGGDDEKMPVEALPCRAMKQPRRRQPGNGTAP
jgi:hypothetical protein